VSYLPTPKREQGLPATERRSAADPQSCRSQSGARRVRLHRRPIRIRQHQEPFEPPDRDYPHVLTTGRVKNQWHTMPRTGKVEALRRMCPEPFLEMNPSDARSCGIVDADFVEITSRRGKAMAQVFVTAEIRPGTCFMPFHWGRQFGFYKAANNLTLTARDPLSGQPELKACAVKVKKLSDFPLSG
jgi:sulfite reductase (NADPH) flavoprotein alpha-component